MIFQLIEKLLRNRTIFKWPNTVVVSFGRCQNSNKLFHVFVVFELLQIFYNLFLFITAFKTCCWHSENGIINIQHGRFKFFFLFNFMYIVVGWLRPELFILFRNVTWKYNKRLINVKHGTKQDNSFRTSFVNLLHFF